MATTATLTADRIPTVGPNGVLLLPERPGRFGPVTRKLLTRLAVVLGVLLVVGTVLVAVSDTTWVRALGLSLVFPGGGLLYVASPLLFLVVLAVLVVAVVLWWGISAQWAIPLVWVVGAALAVGAGRRAPPLRRPRHHLALGDPCRVRPRGPRRRHGSVPHRADVPSQAGPGPRAERLPRRGAGCRTAASPSSTPPTSTPSCCAGPTTWRCSRSTSSTGSTGASRSTARRASGTSSTCSATRWRCTPPTTSPTRRSPSSRRLANLIDKATDLRVWKLLAHAQPDRQLRRQPRPDRPRQHHAVGLPRRADQPLRGGHRLDALRRAGLAHVRVEGRPHVPLRPPLASSRRCGATSRPTSSASSRASRGGCSRPATRMGAQALKGHDTLHGTHLWTRGGAPLAPRRRGRDAHARRQPAPHPLQDDRAVVRHRGGARRRVLPHRHQRLRRRRARPRRTGRACWRCAARTAGWRRCATGSSTACCSSTLEPQPERNTLIVTAVPAVDPPGRRRPRRRRRGPRPGRAARDGADVRHRRAVAASVRCTPASRRIGIHLLLRWGTPLSSADLALRGYRPPQGPILADGPWDRRARDQGPLARRRAPRPPAPPPRTRRVDGAAALRGAHAGGSLPVERPRRGRDPRRRTRWRGHRRGRDRGPARPARWSRRGRRDPQHRQVVDAARRPEGQGSSGARRSPVTGHPSPCRGLPERPGSPSTTAPP